MGLVMMGVDGNGSWEAGLLICGLMKCEVIKGWDGVGRCECCREWDLRCLETYCLGR